MTRWVCIHLDRLLYICTGLILVASNKPVAICKVFVFIILASSLTDLCILSDR